MIVNIEVLEASLQGKVWKSEHSLRASFFKVKIKGGVVTFPTVLTNSSEGESIRVPSHYQLSLYEMGQILGGN